MHGEQCASEHANMGPPYMRTATSSSGPHLAYFSKERLWLRACCRCGPACTSLVYISYTEATPGRRGGDRHTECRQQRGIVPMAGPSKNVPYSWSPP